MSNKMVKNQYKGVNAIPTKKAEINILSDIHSSKKTLHAQPNSFSPIMKPIKTIQQPALYGQQLLPVKTKLPSNVKIQSNNPKNAIATKQSSAVVQNIPNLAREVQSNSSVSSQQFKKIPITQAQLGALLKKQQQLSATNCINLNQPTATEDSMGNSDLNLGYKVVQSNSSVSSQQFKKTPNIQTPLECFQKDRQLPATKNTSTNQPTAVEDQDAIMSISSEMNESNLLQSIQQMIDGAFEKAVKEIKK